MKYANGSCISVNVPFALRKCEVQTHFRRAKGDTENRKIGTPIPITQKIRKKHCKTKPPRANGCTNVRKCILLADDFYDPFQTLVPPTP